jgi:crotonobetainyl-CoA:carnitine CoA-transferase CaiB-like acyl-CoA transferase
VSTRAPGPPTPVADLFVVDLSTRLAGAYATKLLADFGAEVVKVEPPGGDPLRRLTTVPVELPEGEDAPLFRHLCASKRSVVADLSTEQGRGRLLDLVADADVVVDTMPPPGLDGLGLPEELLRERNPAVVLVSVTDFGRDGPWAQRAATEFTLQGWCGSIGFRGTPERPPLQAGGRIGEYLGGAVAAAAALALRRAARATGVGDRVDVSLLECGTFGFQAYEWLHVALMELPSISPSVEVPSVERAKDGFVGFTMVTGQQWADFATMVGRPDLAEDPELCLMLGRWPRRAEVEAAIRPFLESHTVAEILELAEAFRVPASPIGNGATLPSIEHFAARGVYVRGPDGLRVPRPPWRISGAAPRPFGQPPAPDEHAAAPFRAGPKAPRKGARRRAAAELGPPGPGAGAVATGGGGLGTGAGGERLRTGAGGEGPLGGLRVVDLTAFWAGPSATQLLAALGADVVKVESTRRPDGIRFAGGQRQGVEAFWEYGWLFQGVNVNKRGITLDLADPRGVELFRRLVAGADVVIENFSPRVVDALGIGYEALAEVNPAVVMVRMPAFGLDGPWRDRVGFGPTMEQAAGMAFVTGYPDGPPVVPRGPCDPLAGFHAAAALLAALELRDRTGRGSLVEVPMVEVALNVTADQVLEYERFGLLAERQGNRGPDAAPQNLYATAGEGRYVALAVATDAQWRALVRVLGEPAWALDPELRSAAGRRRAQDRIDECLGAWFAARELEQVVEELAAAGVPAASVVSPSEVVHNPQLRARGFFESLEHPVTGPNEYARPPFRLGRGPRRYCRTPAPTLGQHNAEVLCGELGLRAEELEELRAAGVVGERPVGA